jgi:hypothetical protein
MTPFSFWSLLPLLSTCTLARHGQSSCVSEQNAQHCEWNAPMCGLCAVPEEDCTRKGVLQHVILALHLMLLPQKIACSTLTAPVGTPPPSRAANASSSALIAYFCSSSGSRSSWPAPPVASLASCCDRHSAAASSSSASNGCACGASAAAVACTHADYLAIRSVSRHVCVCDSCARAALVATHTHLGSNSCQVACPWKLGHKRCRHCANHR